MTHNPDPTPAPFPLFLPLFIPMFLPSPLPLSPIPLPERSSANALAGSCKMGGDSDPLAVVDTEMRVRGTQRLRVVDASILPAMPGGQLGATAFALAERASDIILATAVPSGEQESMLA